MTYLTWTVENWITVLLMVALGYLLFALLAQVFHRAGFASGGANA